jgi:hypothetical protein
VPTGPSHYQRQNTGAIDYNLDAQLDWLLSELMTPRHSRVQSHAGPYSYYGPSREATVSPENLAIANTVMAMQAQLDQNRDLEERRRLALEVMGGEGTGGGYIGLGEGWEDKDTGASREGMVGAVMPSRRKGEVTATDAAALGDPRYRTDVNWDRGGSGSQDLTALYREMQLADDLRPLEEAYRQEEEMNPGRWTPKKVQLANAIAELKQMRDTARGYREGGRGAGRGAGGGGGAMPSQPPLGATGAAPMAEDPIATVDRLLSKYAGSPDAAPGPAPAAPGVASPGGMMTPSPMPPEGPVGGGMADTAARARARMEELDQPIDPGSDYPGIERGVRGLRRAFAGPRHMMYGEHAADMPDTFVLDNGMRVTARDVPDDVWMNLVDRWLQGRVQGFRSPRLGATGPNAKQPTPVYPR